MMIRNCRPHRLGTLLTDTIGIGALGEHRAVLVHGSGIELAAEQFRLSFLAGLVGSGGHRAGTQHGNTDIGATQFLAQHHRETDAGELRGHVGAHSGHRHQTGHGGGIRDVRATSASLEAGEERRDADELCVGVDPVDPPPGFQRSPVDRAATVHAGVVAQDRDRSERRLGVIRGGPLLGGVTDVEFHAGDHTTGVGRFLHGTGEPGAVDIGE